MRKIINYSFLPGWFAVGLLPKYWRSAFISSRTMFLKTIVIGRKFRVRTILNNSKVIWLASILWAAFCKDAVKSRDPAGGAEWGWGKLSFNPRSVIRTTRAWTTHSSEEASRLWKTKRLGWGRGGEKPDPLKKGQRKPKHKASEICQGFLQGGLLIFYTFASMWS